MAGLAAARTLRRSGKKVVVLEARDRVGGRVKAGKLARHTIDLGGMWVGPGQSQVGGDPAPRQARIPRRFFDGRRALHGSRRAMEERKKMAVDLIVKYFGPEGAKPIDYIDQAWPADPWSWGCYGPSMGPRILTTLGPALRNRFGRVH